jgi:tetratricopeptide (TPR) repeat protein
MRDTMRLFQLLAAASFVLTTTGCTSYSFGHRDTNCNPDERLVALREQYDHAKAGHHEEEILVDCDRVRLELERLSLEFPGHVPTLMTNAAWAYDARETIKAQRYLDTLFSKQPIHPEAAVLRAHIAIDESNIPYARRLLEAQIRYTPDHALLREAHSGALFMAKDYDGASSEILMAERLGAPPARVAYHRGLIAEATGKTDEARKHFKAASDADPKDPRAKSRLSGMNAKGGYNDASSAPGKAGGG